MAVDKLNIGLAGCGHLGSVHAKLINELCLENNSLKFAGVYDIDSKRKTETAEKYNITGFESFESLLKEINALIIVSSTPSHFDIARKALSKNVHLFIEKPVTSTYKEAAKLIEKARGSGVKIQVGHVERFNPALTSLGAYDLKPRFIESHRLAQFNPRGTDVSVVQDLMIHDIDIILSIVDSHVKKIEANGVPVISGNIDIANARIAFANGCVANITASRISLKKMRKMRIFQQNAYISIDFLNNKSEVFKLTAKDAETAGITYPVSDTKKLVYEEPKLENAANINPIKNELESFFSSIIRSKPVRVTLREGAKAVEVADRIMKIIASS